MICAFGKRRLHAIQQFGPLLLQQQALQVRAQFGTRRDEPRLAARFVRRHFGERVPAHAPHQTVGRQIPMRLLAQELRHLTGSVQQFAGRRNFGGHCRQRGRTRTGRRVAARAVRRQRRFHAAFEAAK